MELSTFVDNTTQVDLTTKVDNTNQVDCTTKVDDLRGHSNNISAQKVKPKKGGYQFDERDILSEPTATRHDFIIPAILNGRKTNEELTNGSILLFYKGRVFRSRLHLKDALLAYWFSYALVTFEGNVLLCNCGKQQVKPKKESSLVINDSSLFPPPTKKHRGNNQSSIKVGCDYKVHFTFVDAKNTAGPVRITGACHIHSNHDPSNLSNFTGALIKSHSPFAQLGENVEMMLASNLFMNNHLRGKDFRLMTQGYMPNGVSLTAAEACNLRRRTMANLKDETVLARIEYVHNTQLGLSSLWQDVNLMPELSQNDATNMASSTLARLESSAESTAVGKDYYELGRYLQLLAKVDSSFTFALMKDDESRYIGACWMTGNMRANFELYGSYISLDMCRRELTRNNWSYVAVTTLNEFRRNVICIEGLFFYENEASYAFVCNSLTNMAPGRSSSKVFAFAGDGFFSQETVTSLGFVNASFIHDRWHLLESIKTKFGPIYSQVKAHIHDMIYAETALQFDDSIRLLKSKIPSSNGDLVEYIDGLASQKATFSKYLLEKIQGTLYLVGSSTSEQNHASIMAFIRANSGPYKVNLQQFGCDLLKRQKERTTKLKMELSQSIIKRITTRAEIYSLSFSASEKDAIIFPAIEYLNLPSYELFMKEVEQSKFYLCDENEDSFVIRRSGVNGKHRIISKVIGSRCDCPTLLALGGMCRHEICRHKQFVPSLFNSCHKFRNDIPISRNIGSWRNEYNILTEEGIDHNQAAYNEGDKLVGLDRIGHNDLELYTEENDTVAYQEDNQMNVTVAYEEDGQMKDTDCENSDCDSVDVKISSRPEKVQFPQFKRMTDQLIRGWQNNKSVHLQQLVYGHVCELVKVVTEVDGHLRINNSQHETSTDTTAVVVSRIGTGKVSRLKSSREIVAQRQKTIRKCKFCRLEGHIESNCGVKVNLGRMVDSVTFLTYVLCDSTFRYQTEQDIVKQHLPEGTWFLCCCGVICKTNRLSIPSRFEWRDIVILVKCISDCGLIIEHSLYAGESVEGFVRLHGRRQFFISDRDNTGPLWNVRK